MIEIRAGIYDEDVVVSGRTDLTIVGKGSVTLRATSTGVRVFESNSFKTIDPND